MVSTFVLVLFLAGVPMGAAGPFESLEQCAEWGRVEADLLAEAAASSLLTMQCFPKPAHGDGKGTFRA